MQVKFERRFSYRDRIFFAFTLEGNKSFVCHVRARESLLPLQRVYAYVKGKHKEAREIVGSFRLVNRLNWLGGVTDFEGKTFENIQTMMQNHLERDLIEDIHKFSRER